MSRSNDNASWGDPRLEKGPPADIEAEEAFLAALLHDGSLCLKAATLLEPGELHLDSHKIILDAILRLDERGVPINALSVAMSLSPDLRKSVGGITWLSELENRYPRTDNIEYYARIIRSKAMLRQLDRLGNYISSRSIDEQDSPDEIIEAAYMNITEVHERANSLRAPLFRSFGEFMKTEFTNGEDISLHTRRRELLLCAAITNRGKSTLLRNILLVLSCGGEFKPFVEKGPPRRVLLADFESSGSRLQEDLDRMTEGWPESTLALVRENLLISCEAMVGDDLFSLSTHMQRLEREARRHKADLIAVDTASAAFDLRDENNNSEVARLALKPLLKLARKVDCCVWLMHHMGKGAGEEAKALEKAYKARGASAFGCYATTVFVLTATPGDPDLVTITCAKRKDGEEYERVMRLNRRARWFEQTDETPPPQPPTSREIVRAVVIREMQKADIVSALKDSGIAIRTIENCLAKDVAEGFLKSPRRGLYGPREAPTSTTPLEGCGSGENGNGQDGKAIFAYCSSCGVAGRPRSHCDRCGEFMKASG